MIFLITLLSVLTITSDAPEFLLFGILMDFRWFLVLITGILFFFKKQFSIQTADLVYMIGSLMVFMIFTDRISLALIYPVVAARLLRLNTSIIPRDLFFASSFWIALTMFKNFSDLDTIVYLDRNYVGLTGLFLVHFNKISRKPLMVVALTVAGAFLLSRVFILTVVLYGLLNLAAKFRKDLVVMSNAALVWSLAIMTTASFVYAVNVNYNLYEFESTNDATRLLTVYDASNLNRLEALTKFVDYSFANSTNFLKPVDATNYLNVYEAGTAPHNTLMQIQYNLGFPLLLMYLYYVISMFRGVRGSLIVLLTFIPCLTFLGGVLYGPTLIFFALALQYRSE